MLNIQYVDVTYSFTYVNNLTDIASQMRQQFLLNLILKPLSHSGLMLKRMCLSPLTYKTILFEFFFLISNVSFSHNFPLLLSSKVTYTHSFYTKSVSL